MNASFLKYEKQKEKEKIAIKNLENKLLNIRTKLKINNKNPELLLELKSITKKILEIIS